jgi:N-ethylmaleimide reductase
MHYPSLFSPLKIGPYQLKHRLVMAPLTRMRAEKPSLAPRPLNVEYYAQRATSGGLIVAEASPVMATGFGSPGVPGIYSEHQIKGWREVVDAVHAKGGVIFLQLWHVGRVSHSSFQPGGVLPVAPSAVPISTEFKAMTSDGKVVPYETPRALETAEIPGVIDAYRQGARNALQAGFDGVEIHGANGYLIEQFLQSRTNLRTDQYGGGIENRVRFLMEVTQAVIEVWAPSASACGCRPMALPMAAVRPTRCRFTPTRSNRSTRLALPICILSSRARAVRDVPRSTIKTCRRPWCCIGQSGAAN